MKVHIKFLKHGKGSAAKASAYLLDQYDHKGEIRAGVQVLKGDANTFNTICESSPHLWKYTSGIIAWSKDDAPTSDQINEVLSEFEKHAFAGLDQSQYHLFAVLHTDEDDSKHIHILAPRLDVQSGKSLNIAPPGHETHFDSLRDYFNIKYQWSRPDDLLLSQMTQEPNYVAKLNAQAKKIFSSEDFEKLKANQFRGVLKKYVETLVLTQQVKNRADIIQHLEQLNDVDSIKQSKDFLTIKRKNGQSHRLRGDFYNEQFEIKLYSERLRAAAESRATPSELAAALRDAQSVLADCRAKRTAYYSKQHAFRASELHDSITEQTFEIDTRRSEKLVTAGVTADHRELHRRDRKSITTACEYRYFEVANSDKSNRFVFSINAKAANRDQQQINEHRNRQTQLTDIDQQSSYSSDQRATNRDSESSRKLDSRKVEQSKSEIHNLRNTAQFSVSSFNNFLFSLSSEYELKNDSSAERSYSRESSNDSSARQASEAEANEELIYANRNRSLFDAAKQLVSRAKQLVSRAKQSIDSTSQFIREHFDNLQRVRERIELQNRQAEFRETRTAEVYFSDESRAFKSRASKLVSRTTEDFSRKVEESIRSTIESNRFEIDYQKSSANRNQYASDRFETSTLNDLATNYVNEFLRRFRDAEKANKYATTNSRELNHINQELEQLIKTVNNTRLKPKLCNEFWSIRLDLFYPDYVKNHNQLSEKQDNAFKAKKHSQLIECIKLKSENLIKYVERAARDINKSHYDLFEEIIKNDMKMLKFCNCERVLKASSDQFKEERENYLKCFENFKTVEKYIHYSRNPEQQPQPVQQPQQQQQKKKDLDFDF